MAINLDTARAFRTPDELLRLVEAVRDADLATTEPDWIEWKSQADLADKRWHAECARQIVGPANRMPENALLHAEGCGYVVIGAEPGSVLGVAPIDNADLTSGIVRYVWARWTPSFVQVDGVHVLVLTVEPPSPGDDIVAIHSEYSVVVVLVRDGDVFVRRPGQTARATAADMQALTARARAALEEQVAATAATREPPITLRPGGSSANDLTVSIEVLADNKPQQARLAILRRGVQPSPIDPFSGRPARDGRWESHWQKMSRDDADDWDVYDDGFRRRFACPDEPPVGDLVWVVLSYDLPDGTCSSFWQLWRVSEGPGWSLREAAGRPLRVPAL